MKIRNVLFALILVIGPLYGFSQENSIECTYQFKGSGNDNSITYTLTLKPDRTFQFHTLVRLKRAIADNADSYGRGTWYSTDKRVGGRTLKMIHLTTNPEADVNDEFQLDLNNSKAHYITPSPRDRSGRPKRTSLKFFTSDIFWVEGIEFIKL